MLSVVVHIGYKGGKHCRKTKLHYPQAQVMNFFVSLFLKSDSNIYPNCLLIETNILIITSNNAQTR